MRLRRMLGLQDIEVGYPRFDRDFVIKSNSEHRVRRFFDNERIRDSIELQPRIYLQVRRDERWFAAKAASWRRRSLRNFRMLRRRGVLIGAQLFLCLCASSCEANATQQLIVERLDHVVVEARNPAELFAFVADTLGLPTAWEFQDYGTFASGGVSLGNVNLEITGSDGLLSGVEVARPTALAFDPAPIPDARAELRRRRLRASRPSPYVDDAGDTRWVTIGLPGHSTRGLTAFLVDYRYVNAVARRDRLNDSLVARGGGLLGIEELLEIQLEVTEDRLDAWHQLLAPHDELAPGRWSVGDGPRVAVHVGDESRVIGLIVGVSSLDAAVTALQVTGVRPVQVSEDGQEAEVVIAPGFTIRLTASR